MATPNAAFRLWTLTAATTGGVMMAMVVQIMLGQRGIALGTWQNLSPAAGAHFRAALAWWAIAGAAFIASFAIAAIMLHVSWLYLRFLRGAAAAALIVALASVGHDAVMPADVAALGHALATLAALIVATMMAGFGAYFAVRA